jgi:hypothetical protein
MKQTAVEWLGLELNMLFTDITEEQWNRAEKLFQQAKEMEKQNIIDAFGKDVTWDETKPNSFDYAEQYYNETFNK